MAAFIMRKIKWRYQKNGKRLIFREYESFSVNSY